MFPEVFKSSNYLFSKNSSEPGRCEENNEQLQQLKTSIGQLKESKEVFRSEFQHLQSNSDIQLKDFEMISMQLTQKIIKLKMSRLDIPAN